MCDEKELPLKTFSELKGQEFFIPYQQRGYKWTSTNVEELLEDLKEFIQNKDPKKKLYCLQPLAVVNNNNNSFTVLDGQQRLTTLFLLYVYLFGKNPYTFVYERDVINGSTLSRSQFLLSVSNVTDELAKENIDFYYMHNAYVHIDKVFTSWAEISHKEKNNLSVEFNKENLKSAFRHFLEASCREKSLQIIWYEVEEDKQYEIFRNLNSGKISLTNTELIKALFLNRVSGLPANERLEAAATFEYIESQMQNDHFWYMINGSDLQQGQTRMDFLFNIVADCSEEDYNTDSRCSFRTYFFNNKGSLREKWNNVRRTFIRLKDLYDDIYTYHYIGFLTYYYKYNPLKNAKDLLKHCDKNTHSQFIKSLKDKIKTVLTSKHNSVMDYRYDQSTKHDLRCLFVMHNIETILQKYASLHRNEQLALRKNFEQFPFELLYKQDWDIEHIASNTDSDFTNPTDRKFWLDSIKQDLGSKFTTDENIAKLEQDYEKTQNKEVFNTLYSAIMKKCDGLIKDSIKDEDPDGKDKMQVGNITLLDSHTNRSYHNALFPRKRKYILVADGLYDKTDDLDNGIVKLYIPPCTIQVFTKAYTKSGDLSLNSWTQRDADAYVKDIEQKLEYYFQ